MVYQDLDDDELELLQNSGNSVTQLSDPRVIESKACYMQLKKKIAERKEKKTKELLNQTPEHVFKYAKLKKSSGYVTAQAQAPTSTIAYFGGSNKTPGTKYVHGILNGSGPVTINGYGIEINGESE